MDTSIPALLVATVLLVSTMLLARSGYASFDTLSQSWKEMETLAGDQSRTRLSLVSTQVDGTGTTVTVTLTNEGHTAIADFERVDVVVQYTGDDSNYYMRWIPYTSGALQDNTWTVQSIGNDTFEPGIVNSEETMTLQIRLSPAVAVSSTNWVIISTELGVSLSAYFTR